MAFTIKQQPDKHATVHSSSMDNVWVVYDDDVIGNYKFRYVCKVLVSTSKGTADLGNLSIKVSPNESGHGFFDIGSILKDYTTTQYEGNLGFSNSNPSEQEGNSYVDTHTTNQYKQHSIHYIDKFCQVGVDEKVGYTAWYHLHFYSEFSTTADGQPVLSGIYEDTDDFFIFNGQFQPSSFYNTEIFRTGSNKGEGTNTTEAWNDYYTLATTTGLAGRWGKSEWTFMSPFQQHTTYENHNSYLQPWYDNVYCTWGEQVSNVFMTYAPRRNFVTMNDYHTFSYVNNITITSGFYTPWSGNNWGGTEFGVYAMKINQYKHNHSGTASNPTTYIANTIANGGYHADVISTTRKDATAWFGCGPANLQAGGFTFEADCYMYSVQPMYWGDDCSGSNVYETCGQEQYFILYDHVAESPTVGCESEPIRLAWINPFGAWDYMTFTKKSSMTVSNKSKTYKPLQGKWSGDYYRNSPHQQRSNKVYKNDSSYQMTVNSDWVHSEEHSQWLEELFLSPEVFIIPQRTGTDFYRTPQEPIPVNIADKKFKRKRVRGMKEKGLIQYTLKLDIAIDIKTLRP